MDILERIRRHYMLSDDGELTWTYDLHEWMRWLEHEQRRSGAGQPRLSLTVARDEAGSFGVSTVFMGRDLYIGEDPETPPQVFETMIFRGPYDGYLFRWSTKAQAEEMHRTIHDRLLAGLPPLPERPDG